MSYLRECEKKIISLLQEKTGLEVYVHAPDEAEMPYIHLHDFSSSKWLVIENSHRLKLHATLYSEASSNQEAIALSEKISSAIENLKIANVTFLKSSIDSIEIFQLKNSVWCGSVTVKIHLIGT